MGDTCPMEGWVALVDPNDWPKEALSNRAGRISYSSEPGWWTYIRMVGSFHLEEKGPDYSCIEAAKEEAHP